MAAPRMKTNMQSVEEFMRRSFDEGIAQEKRERASRAPYRRKFYADDCEWGGRPGRRLEVLQTEKVSSVWSSDLRAEVITTREVLDMPGRIHELRYHLQAHSDGWLIYEVDVRCCSCAGEPGKDSCPHCHGTGWRGTNKSLAVPSTRTSSP